MAKKTKTVRVPFECPCDKKISLFKSFDVTENTPPEEAMFSCPSCDQSIKLRLQNQLARDQPVYRGFKA